MIFRINGREFKVERETVHGAQGFTLREWDNVPSGGRNILHDFGIESAPAARTMAQKIVDGRI